MINVNKWKAGGILVYYTICEWFIALMVVEENIVLHECNFKTSVRRKKDSLIS